MTSKLESIVQEKIPPLLVKNDPYSGQVGVWVSVVHGSECFQSGFGQSSRDSDTVPTGETVFEIGSLSKSFCGLLLSKSGLNLTTPLQTFFRFKVPSLNGIPITLLDLATHTSGLPGLAPSTNSLQDFLNFSAERVEECFENCNLEHEPGTHFRYSNFGFGLLGVVLTHHFQKPAFFDALQDEVLKPLGLLKTGVAGSSANHGPLADGHDKNRDRVAHWRFSPDSLYAPAGALVSSGNDMERFLRLNLGLLPSSFSEHFRTTQFLSSGATEERKVGLGLNWDCNDHVTFSGTVVAPMDLFLLSGLTQCKKEES